MKIRRKDVVEYLEHTNPSSLGRCETCKHFTKCNVCSSCSRGSRYSLNWQEIAENEKVTINNYLKEER